jgi:hypothetical protein
MGTRTALAVVMVSTLVAVGGCGSSEPLPDLPKVEEPAPAPVVDTRPKSVPLGESTYQTRSAIGGVFRKPIARVEEANILHQLDIWEAAQNRRIKSNEEFHEKFMQGLGMKYPDLDEGYELVYDPETRTIDQRLIEAPQEGAAEPASDEQP